jgi:hypothetical protein
LSAVPWMEPSSRGLQLQVRAPWLEREAAAIIRRHCCGAR